MVEACFCVVGVREERGLRCDFEKSVCFQRTSLLILKTKKKGLQEKPVVVVVGKAIARTAVLRNRLKRRVRAIIFPYRKRLLYDIVVIAKKGSEIAAYKALQEELTGVMEKLI